MKRVFLALLLSLVAAPAAAILFHGGGSVIVCPQNVAGAQIVAPTSCILISTFGDNYNFGTPSFGTASVQNSNDWNYQYYKGSSAIGSGLAIALASGFGQPLRAFLQVGTPSRGGAGSHAPTQFQLWLDEVSHTQVISPGILIPAYAVDRTNGITYATIGTAVNSGSPNDVIEVLPLPFGLPVYLGDASLGTNSHGMTLNCDPNAPIGAGSAQFQGNFAGVVGTSAGAFTWNNCDIGWAAAGIQIAPSLATWTLNNVNIHDNNQGFLLGGNDGVVTITNSTFNHNGSFLNYGFDHNFYYSTTKNSPQDTGSVVVISSSFLNVEGGGMQFKSRVPSGTISRSVFACTDPIVAGVTNPCDPSAQIDMPCGGTYSISYSVLEKPNSPAGASNPHFMRYAEEQSGSPPPDCPATPWAMSLTLDHLLFVDDGPVTGSNGGCSVALRNVFGNSGITVPITNSIFVNNPSNTTCTTPFCSSGSIRLADDSGHVTDGGGNTCYANRTVAGTALHWPATDRNGVACCAYPYLPPIPEALATLIANTAHNTWVRLNQTTGHGSPVNLVLDYGLTAANFNGALNDPSATSNWPAAAPISGLNPLNDAGLLSFSAPAIRNTDGKICVVGSGGHATGGSGISAVFCFDTQAAAAAINAGGTGGVWTMPVNPARCLAAGDAKPAWSGQNQASTATCGWYTTNPQGVQMPPSCHEYWSNQWVAGTHALIWSGKFCLGDPAGVNPGGVGYYDDDAHVLHYPTLINANTSTGYGFDGVFTRLAPTAMNDLDGCEYVYSDGFFGRWCNLVGTPTLTQVGGTGIDSALGTTQAIMVPDPGNATTRRWFIQYVASGGSNCYTNNALACFDLWRDTGVTPNTTWTHPARVPILGTAPTGAIEAGLCYDSVSNVILAINGGSALNKIADMTTGQLSTTYTNWGWGTYATGSTGDVPPVTTDAGSPATCVSLEPNYHAIIAVITDQVAHTTGVYLYVK